MTCRRAINQARHPTALIPASATVEQDVVISAHAVIGPGCILRRGAKIGMNATIDDNIEIGEYAVIGPGAIITMNVPPRMVMSGPDAKCVGIVKEKQDKALRFAVPPGATARACLACGNSIFWINCNGQNLPLDSDGVVHWETCPASLKSRGRNG